MYEVIVLLDNTICASIVVACTRMDAASKAMKTAIGKGFQRCDVLAVKDVMPCISY